MKRTAKHRLERWSRRFRWGRSDAGQMSVELVMVLPIFLVGLIVMLNVMIFLGECSRFDRIAGEIARASVLHKVAGRPSPAATLKTCLGYAPGSPFRAAVSISGDLHPRVTCTLVYRPWPHLGYSYSGIKVGDWNHAQSFVIDDFDPGVVF